MENLSFAFEFRAEVLSRHADELLLRARRVRPKSAARVALARSRQRDWRGRFVPVQRPWSLWFQLGCACLAVGNVVLVAGALLLP